VEIAVQDGTIVIKKRPNIFDLAGSGAGKGKASEIKKMLDEMREEDA
jgi:hypothetical protein